MNLFSKFCFSISLLSLTQFALATDTRGYNMLPVGTNVIDSQYSVIETTQKSANGLQGKQTQDTLYVRDTYFFDINGQLGAAYILLPYSKQTLDITKPIVLSKNGRGYGDVKVLFALGLYNMPSLTRDEFKRFDKNGLHAACSFAMTFPTGSYDNLSSVNSGANKKTYKPECAAYFVNNKFQADIFLGNTIYADNTSYSGSKTLEQSNLYNLETRFSYSVTPDFWASTDIIYYNGGETTVNGLKQKDKQDNINAGVTLAYRVASTQFIKLIYQKTVSGQQYSPQMKQAIAMTYTLAF